MSWWVWVSLEVGNRQADNQNSVSPSLLYWTRCQSEMEGEWADKQASCGRASEQVGE